MDTKRILFWLLKPLRAGASGTGKDVRWSFLRNKRVKAFIDGQEGGEGQQTRVRKKGDL